MRSIKRTTAYLLCILFLGFSVPVFAFAYESAPRASTLQPTFVTEKSIQLNGTVHPGEMSDTYQWFEWGIVGRKEVYETRHERIYGGSWQTNTNATVIGLAPGTQYFFRQVAENGRGKDVGQTGYVTTKPLASTLSPIAVTTTNDAVFIEESSATLRGYVSPHGNTDTKVWFEWGAGAELENQTPHHGFGGNSGPTEVKIERLMPGTLYYFRAVAENSAGRSYGSMRVFVTRGTPIAVPQGEMPRDQYVPSPVTSSEDDISRTTTTSGGTTASGSVTPSSGGTITLSPIFKNGPGGFLSMLFGKRETDTTEPEEEIVDEEVQLASPAASPLGGLLTGDKSIEVVIEKVGEDVDAHTPVEYRVAYAYRRTSSASDAKLAIVLPADVIYIGDNTNNELLIESGVGPIRTYILPLGKLEKGSTRTISILGMTTGDATGFPDAHARLEYTDAKGTHVIPAEGGEVSGAEANAASVGGVGGKILPTSLWGWALYILFVIGAIIGIRKLKEYYVRKKELLARSEEENERLRSVTFFSKEEGVTPQGA